MQISRVLISLFAAVFVSMTVFFISNDFGIVWDEPIHFRNGDQYLAWYKNPKWENKDEFFRVNNDDVHPPLRKLVAGWTHDIFTNQLKIIDNTRGYRLSVILFLVPFISFLTYIAIGRFGVVIGILVSLMFSLLPHVLFLTPLVTMDYAITALWFMTVMTGIKGIRNNYWLTVSAVCMGLTMLTKLHGYLLLVPIGFIWWMYKGNMRKLIYLVVISVIVYIAGWPWLWTNPLGHLMEYFRVQSAHGSVPVMIFGQIFEFAPWWYVPIMFLVTTPVFVLAFSILGGYWSAKKGNVWDKIITFNAVYPMAFFMLPGVYRYDWVRLFFPAFPFVCLLAGKGIQKALRLVRPQFRNRAMIAVLCIWIVTLYTSVVRIHPWESSYYNELVGGIAGAHQLGFETEYWGNAYVGILPWMNAHKKDPMCVTPTTHPFYYYQAMGQLAAEVEFRVPKETCKYVVVLMRQGLFIRDPFIAGVVSSMTPIHTVSIDGVPLVGVYDISGSR